MDKPSLPATLYGIFRTLYPAAGSGETLSVRSQGKQLLGLTPDSLDLPLPRYNFFHALSNLPDRMVPPGDTEKLARLLSAQKAIVRLNHVGICYPVLDQDKERERLKEAVPETGFRLYEMESNDAGLWLFMGNRDNWEDPMLELLPVGKTDDPWASYWLPHIHLDLDTTLSPESLEEAAHTIFGRRLKPLHSCVIDNVVYTVRLRLGAVAGVNIMLDLSTGKRDTRYSREKLLTQLA